MKEESFEIHSPYIKSSSRGIEEMRSKIVRKNVRDDENLLDIKFTDEEKSSSDGMLRQKILNLSRKAVGEEIRRFAEVASREIGEEFERLENRISQKLNNNETSALILEVSKRVGNVEKAFYQEITNQNGNILSVREGLGKDIDRKIEILSQKLKEIEAKLQNIKNITNDENLNILVVEEKLEEKEKSEEDKDEEEEILLDEQEATNYINKKMKSVASLFEKEGVLFKKNVFLSNIKSKEVEDFLNFKEGYEDIEEKDKDLIENILIELMEKLDIDPKEGENIGEFMQRAYRKEYAKMS